MKFPFKELPGSDAEYVRPVVPVLVESFNVPVACLVDSGSLKNRFASWIAAAAGIPMGDADEEDIALGAVTTRARTVTIDLSIDGMSWRAPVSFCDPWPFPFQILGQEGFFRFFSVTFRVSAYELEIQPDLGHPIGTNT